MLIRVGIYADFRPPGNGKDYYDYQSQQTQNCTGGVCFTTSCDAAGVCVTSTTAPGNAATTATAAPNTNSSKYYFRYFFRYYILIFGQSTWKN